jgi:hypothetical protein
MNRQITMTPFAVGADGVVYANLAHLEGEVLATKLVEYALETPGVLFLGVALTSREAKGLLQVLDNAGDDAIVKAVGRHLRSTKQSRSSSRSR